MTQTDTVAIAWDTNDEPAAKIYDMPTATELHEVWFLRVLTLDYNTSRTVTTWKRDDVRYRRVIARNGDEVIECAVRGEWLPFRRHRDE